MKNYTILLLIITFQINFAQNTFPTTGNVGIGTTTPTGILDIQKSNVNAGGKAVVNIIGSTWEGDGASLVLNQVWHDRHYKTILDNFGGTNAQTGSGLKIQTSYWNGTDINTITSLVLSPSGNLGIGTTTPKSKLTIRSGGTGVSIHPAKAPYYGTIAFNREAFDGEIFDPSGQAFQINNGGNDKNLHFQVYNGNDGKLITNNALVINGSNGNVSIGTANTQSMLTVAGDITSREIKVTVNAGADFVFEKDYDLPSLESVDKFLKQNKHLPEIASAKEMQKDGINLSEMNIKLLQKIEELTLYVIEMKKENDKQNEEIKNLKNEINSTKK